MENKDIYLKGAKDYSDERGNRVIGEVPEGVMVLFAGEGATLKVGKNLEMRGECKGFRLCSGSNLTIGDNVMLNQTGLINLYDEGVIEISDNCRFGPRTFVSSCYKARIFFGEGVTTEQGNDFISLPFSEISFGKDVMISRGVFVQSNDGHVIYDVNTGENINSTEEIARKRKVIIGEHVWIGQSAIVLYNTEIGSGSIVGAGTFVKGKFPNNCTIAGVPAKMVKKDVAWSRHIGDEFLNLPEEWRRKTEI